MSFLQSTPFFRLLVSLLIGIILCQYYDLNPIIQWMIAGMAVGLIILSFYFQNSKYAYRLRWLFGFGIGLLFFLIGYQVTNSSYRKNEFVETNQQAIFIGKLLTEPNEKPNSLACNVLVETMMDSLQTKTINRQALVYIAKDSLSNELQKGDRLMFRTSFQQAPSNLNPEAFDYRQYLQRKGIAATAYIASQEWQYLNNQKSFALMDIAQRFRAKLLKSYEKIGLSEQELAVVSALTLAYKDDLDKDLLENFSHSGAMHVLAVSGLHVGIIYMVLQLVFTAIFRKSKIKILGVLFTICTLWIYAFMTGLPPSVARATTMFSMMALGAALNRKTYIYNTIAVSAFIILFLNPNILFDIGFQMSYAAVISIVYYQPKLRALVYVKGKLMNWLVDLLSVSIAAQIGTLPLSLYYFHQFPNYFLLTNIIIIPLASIVIYAAIIFLIFSPWYYLYIIPAFILKYALYYMNTTVDFIHNLPFALSVFHLNIYQVLLAFGFIILLSLYAYSKRYWTLASGLSLILIFVLSHTIISYKSLQTKAMIVYADSKNTHIDLIKGFQHAALSTDSTAMHYCANNYWKSKKLADPTYLQQAESKFFTFCGQRILVLTDELSYRKQAIKPLETDIVIIGGGIRYKAVDILNDIHCKTCVVDATISNWYAQNIETYCEEQGIQYYNINQRGAFILNTVPLSKL